MIAVSGGLIFAGYQLLVYGWSQVQGSNAGFFDILWPGRYKGNTPDGPAKTSTISAGQGVTNPIGTGVSQGVINQTTANEDVSGNATIAFGPGAFKGLFNKPKESAAGLATNANG